MKKPLLSELTLREKIGQTISIHPVCMEEALKDTEGFFRKYPFGNMWTAGFLKLDFTNMAGELSDYENIDYDVDIVVRKFSEQASKYLKAPFVSSVDAEAGCFGNFPYFSATANQTGLAATGDPQVAYDTGKRVAYELKLAGTRWIWGPVLDNPSPFGGVYIGRYYSNDNIELTKKMVDAYVRGVQSENVIATLKHFPGADKYDYRDPHLSDNCITQSMEEWYERQGAIFEAGIKSGAHSVMIAHCSFPACDDTMVDGRYLPATLSKKIITDLLKEKMGFKGVVITDAIDMRGLTSMFTNDEDFYSALYNAGNDVLLGPKETNCIDIIEEAVRKGKIPESRIDDACQRVLDIKEKAGLFDELSIEVTREMRAQAVEDTAEVNRRNAPKIITWLARKNNLVPLKKENIKKVQIVYTGYSKGVPKNLEILVEEFAKYGAEANIIDYINGQNHIKQIAQENDLIIYAAHLSPHCPLGMPSFYDDVARQFLYILSEGKEKSICVSTGSPYIYFDWYPAAENFLNLYCSEKELLKTFVKGLYGEVEFTGVCPVNPNPLSPRL